MHQSTQYELDMHQMIHINLANKLHKDEEAKFGTILSTKPRDGKIADFRKAFSKARRVIGNTCYFCTDIEGGETEAFLKHFKLIQAIGDAVDQFISLQGCDKLKDATYSVPKTELVDSLTSRLGLTESADIENLKAAVELISLQDPSATEFTACEYVWASLKEKDLVGNEENPKIDSTTTAYGGGDAVSKKLLFQLADLSSYFGDSIPMRTITTGAHDGCEAGLHKLFKLEKSDLGKTNLKTLNDKDSTVFSFKNFQKVLKTVDLAHRVEVETGKFDISKAIAHPDLEDDSSKFAELLFKKIAGSTEPEKITGEKITAYLKALCSSMEEEAAKKFGSQIYNDLKANRGKNDEMTEMTFPQFYAALNAVPTLNHDKKLTCTPKTETVAGDCERDAAEFVKWVKDDVLQKNYRLQYKN